MTENSTPKKTLCLRLVEKPLCLGVFVASFFRFLIWGMSTNDVLILKLFFDTLFAHYPPHKRNAEIPRIT